MKKQFLFSIFLVFTLCVQAQCWQSVSGGVERTAGIKSDGTLWVWGDNGGGVLGTGSTASFLPSPTQIGAGNNWQNVSAGPAHIMAIQSNGTLWGWGGNSNGQVGLGTTGIAYTTPSQVGAATNWQSIATGDAVTFAIQTNGTLWAWGDNAGGVLGDGTQIDRNIPFQIGTDADWQSVSVGWSTRAMAIKTNGTLWVWGTGGSQMGLGPGAFLRILPTQIGTDSDWHMVSVGDQHCIALKTNGTLWTWGDNFSGQLGNGTNIALNIPTQVGTSTNWQSISTFDDHTLAQKTDGSLWSWGANSNGQLGNGTVINSNAPVQIGTSILWQFASAGSEISLVIQTNGTLWAWGYNNTGQLGDGTLTDSYVPIEILSPSITVNTTSTIVCTGSSLTLSGVGATTYTWSGGINDGISFVPASSAIYTVTGTDAIGCYNTATVGITVAPNTTITANATSTAICLGGTVALSGVGSANYAWSNSVVNSQSFTPTATTTYTVADATGCSNTASITVHVVSLPIVTVNNTSVCAGTNALLTASSAPVAGTTYSWSTGHAGNPLNVSPGVTTSYTVTATNTGCNSSAVASVTVVPVILPITAFSYQTPLCATASNPFPTGSTGFYPGGTYSSGPSLSIDPVSGLIDLSGSQVGSHSITYSVAASGCNPANSSTFTITINAPTLPITSFAYPSSLCEKSGNTSPLLASNFTTGGSFSAVGAVISSTNGLIDLVNTPAGTYTVTYAVSAANCVQAGTDAATVTIYPKPALSISPSIVIITGEQAVLNASSSAATYTWFPVTNLSCSDCATPTASPDETTMYCVQTTDGVCSNSTCVTVTVESLCEHDKGLYLPNAFSPNGDGNNDVFCVQGTNRCVTDFTMIIYDRWGEKVFESSDLSTCWDGIYKGKALSPDVFVYFVKAKDQYQKEMIKKGNISLIK